MFKRILVPLDGSAISEQAIPLAASIARAALGSLLLLRVVKKHEESVWLKTGHDHLDTEVKLASTYLDEIALSKELAYINTQCSVVTGPVAASILDVAQEQNMGLIVMCMQFPTNGAMKEHQPQNSTPLFSILTTPKVFRGRSLGSVAQEIVHYSTTPVLILHANGQTLHQDVLRPACILVALDGSPGAEAALLPAAHLVTELAPAGERRVHLVRMVIRPTMTEVAANLRIGIDVQQEAIAEAEAYMRAMSDKIMHTPGIGKGLSVTWTVRVCVDVADELIRLTMAGQDTDTAETHYKLVALSPHRRSPLERWLAGSTTERILNATALPTLVVPASEYYTQPSVHTSKSISL